MHLVRDNRVWTLSDIGGDVGDSDLEGTVSIDFEPETPYVTADLSSRMLDFDDLGIIFGVPVGVGSDETTNAEQREARAAFDADARLIPNVEIDFARLDAVDGIATYSADQVVDSPLALTGLTLDVEINGRVVKFTEARLAMTAGELVTYATIDGSQSPAHTDIKGTVEGVDFASLSLGAFAKGHSNGKFELTTDGDGFRDAAATADGVLSLWSTDAQLRAYFVEAAGLDIGEITALLMDGNEDGPNPSFTPAKCFVARMDFSDGVGTFAPAVIDTEDSLIVLDGQVDMETEGLDFFVRVDAKDASWGQLIGDLHVGGTLRAPSVAIPGGEIVLQTGFAALLAGISGPLAALPFIEPGDGPDVACGGLIQNAQ